MKIEKVHIKNVKGIKDLQLSFKKDNKILDLIVLAGVNGSGKTTILEAIKDFFCSRYLNCNNQIVNLNIFLDILENKFIEDFKIFLNNNSKNKFSNFFHTLLVLPSDIELDTNYRAQTEKYINT